MERDGSVLLIGVNRPAKRDAFNLADTDAGSHRLANVYGRIGVEYGDSRSRPRVAMGQSIHLR